MAKVNLIQKKIVADKNEIILFQIMLYCFLHKISLSDNEMRCIEDLSIVGESDLSEYCMDASEKNFFKSPQSVRNFLCKAEGYGLVKKEGGSKKKVSVSESIGIETKGNIIINLNMIYASKENQGSDS